MLSDLPQALEWARQAGYIEKGYTKDFEPALAEADYLVISLYPEKFIQWVEAYGRYLKPGCIVTDVCGVKNSLVGPVQAALPEGVEFIASHPMAGKEVSGVENSHLVDFAPANFIIVPTEKNTSRGIQFAIDLAKTLGFAHVRVANPDEHDKMIGYVSQLTHAIAVSLMCQPDAERFAPYTGDSFRDLTRIARINGPLWAQLFLANKHYLTEEIDSFTQRLQQLKGFVQADDAQGLEEMFRRSAAARAAFDVNERED